MSSAILFNLDMSEILLSGNGLIKEMNVFVIVKEWRQFIFETALPCTKPSWFMRTVRKKAFENFVNREKVFPNYIFLLFYKP